MILTISIQRRLRASLGAVTLAALVAVGVAGCGESSEKTEAPLIAVEDLLRSPERSEYALSPNGRYLGFLQDWEGRPNIHIQDLDNAEIRRLTADRRMGIRAFKWAGDERLVYPRGFGDDVRILAVNADSTGHLELTAHRGVRARLLEVLEGVTGQILIAMNHPDQRSFDVYRVDIHTGDTVLAARDLGGVSRWIADHHGRVRAATVSDGFEETLFYREIEDVPFRPVTATGFKESLKPLRFTFDDEHMYVRSNIDRDTEAVFTYDPAAGEFIDLVYGHPEVDVRRLMVSVRRQRPTGVVYVTDKRRYHFLDEDRRRLQEELEARLPDMEVVVLDISRDGQRVLVRTYSDVSMGAYHLYDRSEQDLRALDIAAPQLIGVRLAEMQPIQYTARDGVVIHGYLTLPPGRRGKGLPAVIYPHEGPHTRDVWGFDPVVQFLANRGYAVLQMNFRGSSGYGRAFQQAGYKEWGGRMQDDVTDGVRWLIDSGAADPDRIGIYGRAYGGYVALAGVAFTPELYACGADECGTNNLYALLEATPPFWERGREVFHRMIGDPQRDAEMLRRVSPVFHADSIRVPLLIAHGGRDGRVKESDTDAIVGSLKERGIPVVYIHKPEEAHGFRRTENRVELYQELERFLGRHLGGRVTDASGPS
ncbi:MAG: prolyl oligopeptidase family serine peptidase [Candidatus Eisenbacteria bacterium]|nr:prolyl oligopeptidase family serine peptidase [Candidatus Eisenbacteria bacterium]